MLIQKLIDQLRPPVFESVVAELFSQNQALVEVQRNMAQQLDFVGKFRDEFNHVSSFAVEVKKLNSLVDTAFSEAAKSIAAQQLIARTALSSLQYTINRNRELFAANLFQKVWSLELENLAQIVNPSSTDIEEFDLSTYS